MKWVENSRKATDVQNYGHVAEALEISYAKEEVFKAGNFQVQTIATSGTTQGQWQAPASVPTTSGEVGGENGTIDASMKKTLGDDWKVDYRMRSEKYAKLTLTAKMIDGHLVKDDQVKEDVES
jgi:hypothetical protein